MIRKSEIVDFYKDIPFNYTQDIASYKKSIEEYNQILEYIDLHNLLRKREEFFKPLIKTVAEFGCGTGWLTNSIGHYYGKKITSVDFTKKAIDIAQSVSKSMNLNITFKHCDIFDYQDSNLYDLVVSLGVLHHTIDCRKAFKKIANFVKPNGFLYVGLYHLYGRRPMLNFLQNHALWHGENSAFNLFKRMKNDIINEEHSYSWFRDQVIHPHETQHTLEELFDWIEEEGFVLRSTSINQYKSIDNYSKKDLIKLEKELEDYSYNKNINNLEFNPGYFTICAQKIN